MFWNSQNAYGVFTKTLHWLIAVSVVIMLVLGFWHHSISNAMPIHKVLGLFVLALMLVRIMLIHINPGPKLPKGVSFFEQLLSIITKYSLYFVLLILPITGWIFTSVEHKAPELFGVIIPMPWFHDAALKIPFKSMHKLFAWVLLVLIVIHLIGVFKHQIRDKIKIINRMM